MVSVNTKVQTPGQRMKERAARARKMTSVPGVRVEPTRDAMRRLLKHPRAGGFRSEGSVEWPNDTFTKRRLREGSIKLVEQKKADDKNDKKHAAKHHDKPEPGAHENQHEPDAHDAHRSR